MQSTYENHLSVEFQSEINILGQIEHLNLVRFFGYLEDNDERVVVTEYVPNGTLREHLDGKDSSAFIITSPSWTTFHVIESHFCLLALNS